jgi:hypothetical protein
VVRFLNITRPTRITVPKNNGHHFAIAYPTVSALKREPSNMVITPLTMEEVA